MSGWEKYLTPEGHAYYYNQITGETSWDAPPELCENPDDSTAKWIWIPHEVEGYVPAKINAVCYGGTQIEVQTQDGQIQYVSNWENLPTLLPSSLQKITDDLVQMDAMDEAMIAHNLRMRFNKDLIYTNIGTILISVNPFKPLPLYTPSKIYEYSHKGNKELPPHVFNIADAAYRSMVDEKKDQSILISGESGAGKTEATKCVLMYYAEVAGSTNNVERYILLANPILEAFGNSKTVRNNNSSRFGKWVEIHFDKQARICGAKTVNYLLEKSRVVYQAQGERNYHIFYQLCAGAPSDLRARLQLQGPEHYAYLNQSGCIEIEDVNDAEDFREMLDAMTTMNFTEQERNDIFSVVAAILHLGNIEFVDNGNGLAKIANPNELQIASKLLQVDQAALSKALLFRKFAVRGQQPTDIPLDPRKAADGRNALAKTLYGNMFDWLVARINKVMEPPANLQTSVIGVLDIFGFEIFQLNSFEQLCINYANEKLQQNFNQYTFKLEEALYQSEGINYEHVEFIDNQPTLDLIEAKPKGLLCMLDEECVVPKGTDQTFLDKLNATFGQKKCAQYQQVLREKTTFIVKHYAGDVKYEVDGFLDKNRDVLNEDILTVIMSSTSSFLTRLFPKDSSSTRKQSLGSQFKGQLTTLMTRLNSTDPHYIRCVKPNPYKKPGIFEGLMCLQQLRYAGVFEAVRIRQTGFPFRWTHTDFYKRYRCLNPKVQGDNKTKCIRILESLKGNIINEVQVGKTRILYRAPTHRKLELLRNVEVERAIKKIQAGARGRRDRLIAKELKRVKPILLAAIKARDEDKLKKALAESANCRFPLKQIADARNLLAVVVEEKRITAILEKLISQDGEKVFDQLCQALTEAEAINFNTPLVQKAQSMKQHVVDTRKTKADLISGSANYEKDTLERAIKEAARLGFAPTLPDLQKAKQTLERIEKEQLVINELNHALSFGNCVSRDHSTIRTTEMQAALKKAIAFDCRTAEGKQLVALVKITLEIRNALLAEDWDALDRFLKQCREQGFDTQEIKDARAEALLKAKTDEVLMKLSEAIAAYDDYELQFGLEQASGIEMDQDHEILVRSREMLSAIIHAKHLLADALQKVDEQLLVNAVAYCESFGYATEQVAGARALRDRVSYLNKEAAEALSILDKPRMIQVLKEAEEINLNTPTIEEIVTLVRHTSEEKFLQLQLKVAMRMNDAARAIKITIQIKDLFFQAHGHSFEFSKFKQLRTPDEFANAKLLSLNKDKLKFGMLSWTKEALPTSLTNLDSQSSKIACIMFKNILGFMGDKNLSYPETLAEELKAKMGEMPSIRDEIYCQIIKQLTNNPTKTSEEKGWQLMKVLLKFYAPSEKFVNFLEMFLRKNAPSKDYLTLLHEIVYREEHKQNQPQDGAQRPNYDMLLFSGQTVNPSAPVYVAPTAQLDYAPAVDMGRAAASRAPGPVHSVKNARIDRRPSTAAHVLKGVAPTAAPAQASISGLPPQPSEVINELPLPPPPPAADLPPPPPAYPQARVLYDFAGDQEGCLTIQVGDMVSVHNMDPSGWWVGELNGVIGLFPGNYVELV